ncbi:MAG: class II fructose-bisphosphate aldolase [Kiloniellaceae bacterium]
MAERAIIVHTLDEARAAVAAAAQLGVPVTLASAAGAAGYTGALWFREVAATAAAERPEVEVTAVLDCGTKPGLVLAALRQGLKTVRFTGRKSTARTLSEIAAGYGAELITGPFKAVDLLDQPEPEAVCRRWLARR